MACEEERQQRAAHAERACPDLIAVLRRTRVHRDRDAERIVAELRAARAQAEEAVEAAASSAREVADQDDRIRSVLLEIEGERAVGQEAVEALAREGARVKELASERWAGAAVAEARRGEVEELRSRLEAAGRRDVERRAEAVEEALGPLRQRHAQAERAAQEALAEAERRVEQQEQHCITFLETIRSLQCRAARAEEEVGSSADRARVAEAACREAEGTEVQLRAELEAEKRAASEFMAAAKENEHAAWQESSWASHVAKEEAYRLEELLQEMTVAEEWARRGAADARQCADTAARLARDEKHRLVCMLASLEVELQQAHDGREGAQRRLQASEVALAAVERVAQERTAEVRSMQQAPVEVMSEMQERQTVLRSSASAVVERSEVLILGVESEEDREASGAIAHSDPSASIPLSLGARQVYRIGRVHLDAVTAADGPVPVVCCAILQNDGATPWPPGAAIVHASGGSLGLPLLPLGPLPPGEIAEVRLDLAVPVVGGVSRSVWLLRDAATSALLGPALVFEADWRA